MKKAITIWKDTFILLKSWCREDTKSRVSGFDFPKQGEAVTVAIPRASHLAPCVAREQAGFGQRCGMCLQNGFPVCCQAVHMGANL